MTLTASRPAASARWAVRAPADPGAVKTLARKLSVPPLLASILLSRGLGENAASQLEPPLTLTQIPDLFKAAERLEDALKHKRRIMIHGDYDADGVSGTAVLTLGLRALGGNVIPFIPNRLTDGYGIHPDRVEDHKERAELFITVDCGITNLPEIKRLQEAGVEVIVSDHHQPGKALPDCLIVHPKMSPLARQGLPELTGAGVAYHLLWALHERLGLDTPLEYSDIATIGTIADVAPLMGENRALITEGLKRMAASNWPGLRAALAQSRLRGAPSARDVAFVIAPRLNAAGRLGEAEAGLELLMTASERRARELAVYLDARNSERRAIQDEMFEDALARVDLDAPAVILDDPDWHPGIMGIVASKILECHFKPVFIIAKGKGSVRSVPGLSAVGALDHAATTLKRYGGHSQAAGFAIRDDNITAFREAIYHYVTANPAPERRIIADALISASEIDDDLYKAISKLEPYGQGHPSPLFALTDRLDAARAVGKSGNTLQLRVAGIKGVAWQKGDLAKSLDVGTTVNAVVSLRESFWQNKRSLEFVAEEVRSAERLAFQDETHPAEQVKRGAPATGTACIKGSSLEDLNPIVDKAVHLTSLPLATPLSATEPLSNLLGRARLIYFDLSATTLADLEKNLGLYPSLTDLRHGFVCLQRGQGLPYGPDKNALVITILQELELLNEQGKPYRRQKRDPYTSDTLLSGLMEQYKLRTFINAYRYLDDSAFASTVVRLFEDSPN